MPHAVFLCQSFCLSFCLSLSHVRACVHTQFCCVPQAGLCLEPQFPSFCPPSVGIAGICYCPAHSTIFSFNSPAAACWSSGCGTDAMKSLTRFLILDGFCFFGSLISRLNLWSFSSDRGVHCSESHLETMARLHLSLLLVQHCVLCHLCFGFVFCFPSCR